MIASLDISIANPSCTAFHTTSVALVALLVLVASCAEDIEPRGDEPFDSRSLEANVPGPWQIPPEVEEAGEESDVEYTGAGPWNGGANCKGEATSGAFVLRDWLLEEWPQISSIGIYRCSEIGNTGLLSVHGTGRALDLMIPTINGEADNTAGDPIGNWLILNAEEIGIQAIIWDSWRWYADHWPRSGPYSGSHPHHDHLHIELSVAGANQQTPWFQDQPGSPDLGGCGQLLPADGGQIHHRDPCFQKFGSDDFWRRVDSGGIDGGYWWTNAFRANEPSNWARWNIELEVDGNYLVEYSSPSQHSVFDSVRYNIRHDQTISEVIADPTSHSGPWHVLGEFEFAAGTDQWVAVYDNYDFDVASNQHIAVDAIRLTRLDPLPEPDPQPDSQPDPDPIEDEIFVPEQDTGFHDAGFDDTGHSGPRRSDAGDNQAEDDPLVNGPLCQTTAQSPTEWGLFALALLLLATRTNKRRRLS